MRSVARRHPVGLFFALAFVLTWAVWVPRALASQGVITASWPQELGSMWSYGPAEAAVIVAALIGKDALRDLGARLVRWRVRWWWYAVVLLGPAAFWILVVLVLRILGWSDGVALPPLFSVGPAGVLPLFLVLVLTDGVGEETGWRGFALPRQLARTGYLPASLVLGLVWATWHLPLVWTEGSPLFGISPWVLFLELPAMAVVYTFVFLHTAGSALIAILLHAAWNASALNASVAGADDGRVTALVLVLEWLVAGAVIATWRAPSRRRWRFKRRTPGVARPDRGR
jgi:uncharacterized protein